MAKAAPWTPKQDALLRRYHGVLSREEIARLAGRRTVMAYGVRASRLGIRSLRTGDIAPELGVSIVTVVRWIKKGFLQARRTVTITYKGKQNPQWYEIQEEAIIQFLQTHYLRYDPSRLVERWQKYVPWKERAKWISISEASKQHSYGYQWFYQRIWRGEIRVTKGRNPTRAGEITYLFREDIESVMKRIQTM
ncbi:MAG: hypothetical protein Greene071421_109 [Parcubacteria group bacterium Greene0714_21]|nr:MAG: hypothetical protein Greene041639_242 [Parcubacteria group bacterium Greene0416_39]TSC98511.1 MAG: hypothetical protein Greene101447_13 [Parcubacteria group bacterium Greene1014_47]TSD04273.1 MAG: hypothetical protein Greene071421_109 [Parcubacteria group bacterium Greene0714_21]